MRLAEIIAACWCCYLGLVEPISARGYQEKTRFDRSVDDAWDHEAEAYHITIDDKPRIFTDSATHYSAFKDAGQSVCYLEKLKNDLADVNRWRDVIRDNKRTIHASDPRLITKFEAWRLAGDRVVDFCHGMTMILLQESEPRHPLHPSRNELPEDVAVHKRRANVLPTDLDAAVGGRGFRKERVSSRKKRDAAPYRGKFRGQTQSQYLNVGGSDNNQREGKAEAEATQQSSRAVVSGSSGMGQAQSMSSGADGCEGCPGYDRIGGVGTIPIGTLPGTVTPGVGSGTVTYPSVPGTQTIGGTYVPQIGTPGTSGGTIMYPGGTAPGVTEGGGGALPGVQVLGGQPGISGQIPGRGLYQPGTQITGEGGGLYPPGTGGTGSLPNGRIPGSVTTGGIPGTLTYPGAPGTQVTGGTYTPQISTPGTSGGTIMYPGSTAPGVTVGGTGTIPGTQILGGQPGISGPTSNRGVYQPGTQVTGGGGGVYPSGAGTVPGGTGTISPGTLPGTVMGGGTPGTMTYPGVPGTQVSGGTYVPQIGTPGASGGTIMYPGGTAPGLIGEGTGTIPGTQVLGGQQGILGPTSNRGVYQPGTQVTGGGGVYPSGTGTVPGGTGTISPGTLPGNVMGGGTPGTMTYPGVPGTRVSGGTYVPQIGTPGTSGGTIMYPGGTAPGLIGGGTGTIPGVQVFGGQQGILGPTSGRGVYQPGTQVMGGEGIYTQGTGAAPGGIGTLPRGTLPGTVTGGSTPGTMTYPGAPGTQVIGGTYTPQIGTPGASGGTIMYPGGTAPGVTGGGTGVMPGAQVLGGQPGISGQIPGRSVYKPGMQVTGGGGGVYPPGTGAATGGIGGIPGTLTYPGTQVTGGTYTPQIGTPGTSGGTIMYPGGTSPGVTGGGTGTIPGTQVLGGQPGVSGPTINRGVYQPGAQTMGGGGVYPQGTGVVPGGIGTIPSGTLPGTVMGGSIPGTMTYPGAPGTQVIGGTYTPQIGTPGASGGTIMYPGGTAPGVTGGGTGVMPGIQVLGGQPGTVAGEVVNSQGMPTTMGGVYPPGAQVTGGTVPGQIPGGVGYPQQSPGAPNIQVPGGGQVPTGTMYPPGMIPSMIPGSQVSGGTYTPGSPTVGGVQVPGSGVYLPPGTQLTGGRNVQPSNGAVYPQVSGGTYGGGGGIPSIPGSTTLNGTPGGKIEGQQKPIARGDIPGTVVYPSGQDGGQVQAGTPDSSLPTTTVPGGTYVYPGGVTGTYPGTGQYPGGLVPTGTATIGIPGQGGVVVGPGGQVIGGQQQGGVVIGGDDGSDSQAISSVKQSEAGTQASATAEGKHGQGSAKSQVSGTYTGSGSFSAQAGTSDATKSAQTQVSGGKEGAKSSSQGSGGLGKSQTQVELDSDTGATSTNAQSSGWNHGTNSQVQASGKGGMADAQANGEGQTSSQAQIGFQPYVNRNEKVERLEKPFRGGGTASAQSGTFRGQSQSQLQGSFHYGITYSGAAQAGSGSGAAALRKPFNFTNNDSSLFKPFKFDNNNNKKEEKVETTTEIVPKEQLQGSSSRQTVIAITSRNGQVDKKNYKAEAPPQPYENEDEYEEYEDEEYTAEANRKATTSVAPQTTKQTMRVVTDGEYDVSVKHEESTTEEANGHSLPGYVAHRDSGHRGKIASVAGRRTIAQGDGRAQSQTVSLVPVNRTTGKPAVSDTRSLTTRPTDRVGGIYYGGMKAFTDAQETTPKTSYVSVSNSVAGKMDDKSEVKKYEHRYYTKSSTCGYFTFSCNVVYGSNGRRKICKPKMPTNADGTPKC